MLVVDEVRRGEEGVDRGREVAAGLDVMEA